MKDFSYAAPAGLDEATSLLAEWGERAKILAGGTDILVQLREGLREAEMVVDVKKIAELMELAYTPDSGVAIGSLRPLLPDL